MTKVTNSDHIMALVRNQLQRMSERGKTGKARRPGKTQSRILTAHERVRALSAIQDMSDEEFTRNLVRSLLSEELGERISVSSGFQNVVERTTQALRGDPEIVELLRRVRTAA